MQNIVSTRFIECLNLLKDKRLVRSYRQFALACNIHPQSLNEIVKGKRKVTVKMIKTAVIQFKFNPIYLYTGEGVKFLEADGTLPGTNKLLTIVTDGNNKERILHIPIHAQAGYGESINDSLFFEELESFSLPGQDFMSRTQRSFEIFGDSMEPYVESGDRVVCSFVEPECWSSNIRTGMVYVVVTEKDILLKRAENLIKEKGILRLHSDNDFYDSIEIPASDILEVWIVKMKISDFNHNVSKVQEENEIIKNQALQIARLQEKLKEYNKEVSLA